MLRYHVDKLLDSNLEKVNGSVSKERRKNSGCLRVGGHESMEPLKNNFAEHDMFYICPVDAVSVLCSGKDLYGSSS